MIDLRSDTVTQPSPPMREAMASAPVGDDVFGEDPTVRLLEERAAELLGTERALFVPSGTMANQIALLVHCRPGDDVIVGEGAHSLLYEGGASGAIAGVQLTVVGKGGLYSAADAEPSIKPDNHIHPPTTLLMAENTHNRGGGRVFPLEDLKALRVLADTRGINFHIDGARLLNAAVATGMPPQVYGQLAHSLSLCLSKGLGAPVGSLVAGSQRFVERAHRYRKMLGGGMRQAGILAAAGLFALEHNVARLAEDHRRARAFAQGLSDIPGIAVDARTVETNIVIFEVTAPEWTASRLEAAAREQGLLFFAIGPRHVRTVFHLHVDDAAVSGALEIVQSALARA